MLESVCPIARSFTEVEKLCVDSWTTYEPFMTDDVEATAGSRRCVPFPSSFSLPLRRARP